MTGATRSPERTAVSFVPELTPTPPDTVARIWKDSSYWPITRLVGWSCTLMLGISLVGPLALDGSRGLAWLALLLPALVATLAARALYETLGCAGRPHRILGRMALSVPATLLALGVMAGGAAIVGVGFSLPIALSMAALTTLTLVGAGAARDVEIRVRLSLRRVYFIGSAESQRDLARELLRHHAARLVGATTAVAAERAALIKAVFVAKATVLVLDAEAMRVPEIVDVASQLNLAGLRIRDLVSYYEAEFKKVPLSELSPTWFLFDIASIHRRRVYNALNRGCEMALAVVLLLAAGPIVLLAGLAIRLTSPGPVLYRQRRVGRNNSHFTLLKLRTMTQNAESAASWAPSEGHRITRVGRILRCFRVDELPQLWNVLRGDLALIGPRPEQVPIVERLERELPHYSARHCVRPGLTGWAQVNLGYAGSPEETLAKLQQDLYYVKHASLRLDALILWLTLKTVIAGRE